MNKILTSMNKIWNNYCIRAFLLGLGVSFLFFIPFIIYDQGYFLYYGDYNVQEVPFYRLVHDAIRNGEFFWNYKTDLGANLIGSYTFYMIGSPFFWLTLPFESNAVPYLMGPLLILKYGFICLSGYIYLKRYVVNKELAILGSLLYTFSGFSLYNIFFFHFHEALITFPLLLSALDSYMYERKRGVFSLAVFFSVIVNYYFFAGQAVFLIIYWVVRMLFKSWKISVRDIFMLVIEGLLGIMMSCILLIPSFLAVIQNPRVNGPPIGWQAILYEPVQRYMHILQAFFFPPDIPARPNFTPDSNSKWASLGAWFPLFSMSGVIAFVNSRNRHWLKRLLIILFICCFIPVLNSSFQLFNITYYARWFYMLTLMMSLATMLSLNSYKSDWNKAIKITLIITLCIAIPIGLLPDKKDSNIKIGLMDYPCRFWIYVSISIMSLLFLLVIMRLFIDSKNTLIKAASLVTMFISVFYSMFIIALGKSQSYDTQNFIIPYSLNGGRDINLPDKENCRIDIYNGMDNQAMFWQIPTIQAFHTIVPGSIMEFYPSIGVTRDVGSRPDTRVYGVRGLTSCKWLFDYPFDDKDFSDPVNGNAMPGFSYYDYQNGFKIYKNDFFIPYGFTYDNYVTVTQFNGVDTKNRHLLMLKAIVLSDEQANRHSDILNNIKNPRSLEYSESEYFKDCEARKSLVCNYFSYDKNGFTAKIDLKDNSDQLVFFSVPYENGWKASINSEDAMIEKVNIGFMAVRVPGGRESIIRFTYMTPGLILGTYVTAAGLVLFLIYLIISKIFFKNDVLNKRIKYKPADLSDKNLLSHNIKN